MWRRCCLRHALCVGALHWAGLTAAQADEPLPAPQGAPLSEPAAAPEPALPAPMDLAAEVRLHENGRLAAVLCQGQPLRAARCRYGTLTGLVLTYYPTGSVAEVLAFRDGWLDGVTEVYDPTGHLLERAVYRAGSAVPPSEVAAVSPAPDPPLPMPPSLPPSAAEAGTADAADGSAPTTIEPTSAAPQPSSAEAPVASRRPAAAVDSQPIFGLGVRGLLGGLVGSAASAGIGGGQLVFAMSPSPGTYPELAVGVSSTFDAKGAYRRLDVPISLGLIVHLSRATAPLYMALSFDAMYALRTVPGDVPGPKAEEAWLLGGSGGFGIDMPMWNGDRSQGRMLMDVRLGGTGRIDTSPPLLIPQDSGDPQAAIAGQFRVLLTLTAQANFGG